VSLHLKVAFKVGCRAARHPPLGARERERAAAQTSPMGGSTSRAGQTRDSGVDRLRQHKTAPAGQRRHHEVVTIPVVPC
jgi:hypothetical protein